VVSVGAICFSTAARRHFQAKTGATILSLTPVKPRAELFIEVLPFNIAASALLILSIVSTLRFYRQPSKTLYFCALVQMAAAFYLLVLGIARNSFAAFN
jgi:hypothetical protein